MRFFNLCNPLGSCTKVFRAKERCKSDSRDEATLGVISVIELPERSIPIRFVNRVNSCGTSVRPRFLRLMCLGLELAARSRNSLFVAFSPEGSVDTLIPMSLKRKGIGGIGKRWKRGEW